jgi:hypothetical protein
MRNAVRSKLEMAARVRVFCRTHPSEDPGYATVLGRFEERLTRAEAIAARQHDGRITARGARSRRAEIRRVIHFQLLRYLVNIGGIASRTRSELAERFDLPDLHGSNRSFLTSVRSMLAIAEGHREALVGEGMTPALLEQLGKLLAEFEAVSESARASRLDHIGARADLEKVTAELVEAVRTLDGINRWRFGEQPELMVEWNAARHVPAIRVTPREGEDVTAREQSDRSSPVADGIVPPGGVAPAA